MSIATFEPLFVPVQQNQSGTLGAYWERDGAAYDPGAGVTVTITNDEGTVLVNAGAAVGSGTSGRTYVLPVSATATLDKLTVTWTAPTDGSVLTTYAEIVGGFYFSIAQARMRSPLQDDTTYPTYAIQYYRMLAEKSLDDICGVAFVPRFSHETARITSWGLLSLPRRDVTAVRAIFTMSDSGPVMISTLTGVRIMPGGDIFMPALFNWWSSPITVAFEHGFTYTPPRVSRAALELARRWLVESPWDERMTAFRSREGGEVDILTGKTRQGISNAFDLPEVQAVAEIYGTPLLF